LAYSASRTAPNIAHLHSIYTCTFAILFFGTPHNGSSKARLLGSLQKLVSLTTPKKVVQTESSLVNALEEESETLQNITDQFAPLMSNFRVYFFWEQEKTDLKYTKDYIVDESSAAPILDNVERSGIAADHRGICRFETSSSQGFRLVVAALQRYSRDAPDVVKARMVRAAVAMSTRRWYEATDLVKEVQWASTNNDEGESARRLQGHSGSLPALSQYSEVQAECATVNELARAG
jgi:protein SERAC1